MDPYCPESAEAAGDHHPRGSSLIQSADRLSVVATLLQFLERFTLFFWAAATWWIPLPAWVGVWRHVLRRYPLADGPEYWGPVFPLGMYAACGFQLVQATGVDVLLPIRTLFLRGYRRVGGDVRRSVAYLAGSVRVRER